MTKTAQLSRWHNTSKKRAGETDKPKVVRLGKLHACLLTRRSCQELLGYCERHGMGHKLDQVVD